MSRCVLFILCALFSFKGSSANPDRYILLNDGYFIPTLGLGTAVPIGQITDVRRAVRTAIELGYRLIDTAAIYADEYVIGQGIADAICEGYVKRKDLFIVTKLWNTNHVRDQVVPALKRSLLKLGLDYVDMYLIHSPLAEDKNGKEIQIDILETWQGMQDARDLGLTRSIGVSNFNKSDIIRIIDNSFTIPAVNEIEVNPTYTNTELIEFCQRLNITVMGYSSFGFLVPRFAPNPPPPRFSDPVLVEIATKYNKLPSQVVLRFGLDRGVVALTRSVTYSHIRSNIDLYDFKLTEREINAICSFNVNKKVYRFPINSEVTSLFYNTNVTNPLNLIFSQDNI